MLAFKSYSKHPVTMTGIILNKFRLARCLLYSIFCQYIILNHGIFNLNSSALPSSKGYISQYTTKEVYGLIVNEINKGKH